MAVVAPGAEIGRERTPRHVPRHPHVAAYAALVLRGGYVEAGDRGRFRARAGDLLVHDRYEAHQDHFGPDGADILNLLLAGAPGFAFGRVADPDAVVRAAEQDGRDAALLLVETALPCASGEQDWPDRLATALGGTATFRLEAWAEEAGLCPQSVSRGFAKAYGVSPQRYRLERRAARAARAISDGAASLADIAFDCGFADQPHMTRTLRRLYGTTPAALRAGPAQCVQDGSRPTS